MGWQWFLKKIFYPFFGAILPENCPEVNNALERKTRSSEIISVNVILPHLIS